MKICRVSNSYPYEGSPGSGLVPFFLSKHINVPTLYITRYHPGKYRMVPPNVILKKIKYNEEPTPESLRNELQKTSNFTNKIINQLVTHLKFIKTLRGITFMIKSIPYMFVFRPDIVVCHQSITILHGIFGKYCLGAKFILHIHNNSEIVVIRNLTLLRKLVNKVDMVFCLTSRMGKILVDSVPELENRVIYTSTGVDTAKFKNINLKRINQVVAIGHFRWAKGYDYLIDAFSIVFRKFPQYCFKIVGEGPEKPRIVKKINELGLSENIHLLGICSQDKIIKLLNRSKLFVMSSISEGLPKVLLEALACGTPGVITNECNADHIIDGCGLMVEARNSESLARAIKTLLEDDLLWEKYSRNACTIANEYDWKNVVQKVAKNYQSLNSNSK